MRGLFQKNLKIETLGEMLLSFRTSFGWAELDIYLGIRSGIGTLL